MTLEEYCNGCHKMVNGRCSVYQDPAAKVGANRLFSIGCAFSRTSGSGQLLREEKKRLGQQKSKKKSKQTKWRTYKTKNDTKLSRMKRNVS